MKARVLVAGIGNIFLGDDAFGCEVVKRLERSEFPDNVRIFDFGIRGFDLAYALMDGYDLTILVDAVPRGDVPGTVYTIEPDLDELNLIDQSASMIETHGMNPVRVLQMAKSMGATFRKILLVGCEPETLGPEEGQLGLSPPVVAAVDRAAQITMDLINDFLRKNTKIWEANGHGTTQWVGDRM
jgi:hydrogenase maturation protease